MRIDQSPPVPPSDPAAIAAATVVIAREHAGRLEVLVIERAQAMGFAGGAIAFPGGKCDPGDMAAGPPFHGFAEMEAGDAIARVTAVREAFEETGVLLSAGPFVAPETRAHLRRQSDRHAIVFGALLADIGHRLHAATLKPFSRWLPPEGLHKRFDTRFYLAALPEGEAHLADGHEAVQARWARPAALLDEADAGAISLLFPTRCNLARLAQFASLDRLMADPTPAAFVQPRIVAEDGEPWLIIPDGLGYPYRRERLAGLRRE